MIRANRALESVKKNQEIWYGI